MPTRSRLLTPLTPMSDHMTLQITRIQWSLLLALSLTSACDRESSNSDAVAVSTTAQARTQSEEQHPEGIVTLDTVALRLGGITVSTAEAYAVTGLAVTGVITYDANRVSHIGARTHGRVVALPATLGAHVRQGQVLALLESPEVGEIRTQENEAKALIKIAQENYAREKRLADEGISSRKELLQAEAELRRMEASLSSAEERLRVLGAGHGRGGEFAVIAPFSGVVVARDASLGEMAGPEANLFTVADLSRVWIEFDVFERDIAKIHREQTVSVTVPAFPRKTFPGRVVYVSEIVDTTRRTVRARVDLPNTTAALKPGMFAKGRIETETGGTVLAMVPQDAVQEVEKRRVVFVPGTRLGEFRAIPVDIGDILDNNMVVIRHGLSPNSRVVTTGAFTLRAELQKEELAEGEH